MAKKKVFVSAGRRADGTPVAAHMRTVDVNAIPTYMDLKNSLFTVQSPTQTKDVSSIEPYDIPQFTLDAIDDMRETLHPRDAYQGLLDLSNSIADRMESIEGVENVTMECAFGGIPVSISKEFEVTQAYGGYYAISKDHDADRVISDLEDFESALSLLDDALDVVTSETPVIEPDRIYWRNEHETAKKQVLDGWQLEPGQKDFYDKSKLFFEENPDAVNFRADITLTPRHFLAGIRE